MGKTVISVGKKAQKGLTDALHSCEKSWVNGLVLWFIHILKTVHVQQLKGMQSSKLGMWKEYHCQEKVYEGVPFLSKMVYKRVWGWTSRRGLPVWNFVEKLGSFNLCWIPKDALLLYKTRWNYVNKISAAFFFFLPWMVNSRRWGLLSCQIPRGGDEKRGQMLRPPSTPQHFSLIARSNSAVLSILMCSFLFQLTSSFITALWF